LFTDFALRALQGLRMFAFIGQLILELADLIMGCSVLPISQIQAFTQVSDLLFLTTVFGLCRLQTLLRVMLLLLGRAQLLLQGLAGSLTFAQLRRQLLQLLFGTL